MADSGLHPPSPVEPPLPGIAVDSKQEVQSASFRFNPPRDGGRVGAWATMLGILVVTSLAALTILGRLWLDAPLFLSIAVSLLPYLYLFTLMGLFGLWCIIPDRRSVPAAMAAVVLLAFVVWGRGWRFIEVPDSESALRVLSWNVRRRWGHETGPVNQENIKVATQCLREVIVAESPDIITLLEVSEEDVKALIQQLIPSVTYQCTQGDYFASGNSKRSGAAICVSDRNGLELKQAYSRRFVDSKRWSYQFAEVDYQGQLFNVLAVHLEPYHSAAEEIQAGVHGIEKGDPDGILHLQRAGEQVVRAQVDQSGALLDRLSKLHDPTLVAGDFNSTPDSALHVNLRTMLQDSWIGGLGFGGTARIAGWLPVRVDFIYATKEFGVGSTRVVGEKCSDHAAVISELTLQ